MMRATYMRVLKFFLFPITHKAMFGTAENKGSPATKAAAAAVASLPEGFTIQPLEVAKIALQLVPTCLGEWGILPLFLDPPPCCSALIRTQLHAHARAIPGEIIQE